MPLWETQSYIRCCKPSHGWSHQVLPLWNIVINKLHKFLNTYIVQFSYPLKLFHDDPLSFFSKNSLIQDQYSVLHMVPSKVSSFSPPTLHQQVSNLLHCLSQFREHFVLPFYYQFFMWEASMDLKKAIPLGIFTKKFKIVLLLSVHHHYSAFCLLPNNHVFFIVISIML